MSRLEVERERQTTVGIKIRVETFKVSTLRLTNSTGAENRIVNRGNVKKKLCHLRGGYGEF